MTAGTPAQPRSLMDGDTCIETQRLTIREVNAGDAPFILRLLNEPSFIRYIGDKRVRTLADACAYIDSGPISSYAKHGFGLYRVALKDGDTPVGTCGLLKRETMDHPDLGFAFLPEYWLRGYAIESARAVIERGRRIQRLARIVAVTAPDNHASIGLLTKLGFVFETTLDSFGDSGESNFYVLDLQTG